MSLDVDPHSPVLRPESAEDVAFDWPPACPQASTDTDLGWTTPGPVRAEDVDSRKPEPPDDDSATVSGSPPPVIVAFADQRYDRQPPPRRDLGSPAISWPTMVAFAAVAVAVIVLTVTITVVFIPRGGPSPAAPTTALTTAAAPVATPPPPTVTVTTAPPTATVTAPPVTVTAAPLPITRPTAYPVPSVPQYPPPSSSLQQLRAQAGRDYPVVAMWAKGRWFPQLSSKQPGIVDDGITWDYDSIWREHLLLRRQYGAVLLWSGDWPTMFPRHPDYWVTIASYYPFADADGAREWCRSQGRDSDHCFPKQIQ